MTDREGPLARLKQRTYMVILLVGLAGASTAWLSNALAGTLLPFTRNVFLTVIIFATLQLWLLRNKRVPIRLIEDSLYLFTSVVMLSTLVYTVYLDLPAPAAHVSLFSLCLWFPFIYIFIFLAYDSRDALLRSGILYLLALGVSLPRALALPGFEGPFEGLNFLGQSYISTAAIIAVLFFLTKMKDQLLEIQGVAEQMETLARTDVLTGISNRRQIEELLEQEIERAMRYDVPLTLISFDLDDFKRLNDTFGHDIGDAVLVELARLIEPHLRASDRFGRWGGEEFMIVTTETPLESSQQLAVRLRAVIESHDFGLSQLLSASFGVTAHRPGDNSRTLIKRADVALYRAKEQGKNCVEVEPAA